MKATSSDLRHNMKTILQALKANEAITLLYRGKEKGIIVPIQSSPHISVDQHPFFGMNAGDTKDSVENVMEKLRGNRY